MSYRVSLYSKKGNAFCKSVVCDHLPKIYIPRYAKPSPPSSKVPPSPSIISTSPQKSYYSTFTAITPSSIMSRRPMPTTEGEMEQFMREIAYSHPHILVALSTGNQEPLKQLLEERWPTHSRPAMGVDWLASREARHELTRCRSERCQSCPIS